MGVVWVAGGPTIGRPCNFPWKAETWLHDFTFWIRKTFHESTYGAVEWWYVATWSVCLDKSFKTWRPFISWSKHLVWNLGLQRERVVSRFLQTGSPRPKRPNTQSKCLILGTTEQRNNPSLLYEGVASLCPWSDVALAAFASECLWAQVRRLFSKNDRIL